MTPNEIFKKIEQFSTMTELKKWMIEIGYDLNPDYAGLKDEMEHGNYQNHFYVDILHSELNRIKISSDTKGVVILNNNNEELLADDLDSSNYGHFTLGMDSHILLNL